MKIRKRRGEWKDVPFTNDYMFCTVMEDEECCKEFLKRVLGIDALEIKYVTRQMSIRNRLRSKGVRLDVYVVDVEGNAYDIEMQATKDKSIPKRTRYYHSEMDGYQIRKGKDYNQLGQNIVIFVCTYDPFGLNRSIYTFKNICVEDKDIELNDGTMSIFLNATGDRVEVEDELGNVLDYIKTGKSQDAYTEGIANKVREINGDRDWRKRNMTLEMKLKDRYEAGVEYGMEAGEGVGTLKTLIRLYIENDISKEKAVEVSGLSDEMFETEVEKYKKNYR